MSEQTLVGPVAGFYTAISSTDPCFFDRANVGVTLHLGNQAEGDTWAWYEITAIEKTAVNVTVTLRPTRYGDNPEGKTE